MMPLSVLDLSSVTTQTPPSQALQRSVELAQAVERFGN